MTSEGHKEDALIEPALFENDLHKVLAVLNNGGLQQNQNWISSLQISHILRESYGISLHWRTIDKLLETNSRQLVDRRKRKKRWEYYLLSDGREEIMSQDSQITLIDPANALKATISLHSLLSELNGHVRICDPYLDPSTIEHIEVVPNGVNLKLLTKTIRDSGKLRRLITAARSDFQSFDLREAKSAPLHDRYIIDDSSMMILGTSLNGFAKKQCFIVKAGTDIRNATIKAFDDIWSSSSKWP
jgi:hypothetical protein